MTRRLFVGYLGLALVVLVALVVPLGILNAQGERRDLRANLHREAATVGSVSEDALEQDRMNDPRLRALLTRYADATDARISVADRSGRVIAESGGPAGPQIAGAVAISVSTPVVSNGRLLGAVRSTYPMASLNRHIARYWLALAVVAASVFVAAALASVLLSRSLVRPLRHVEEAAKRVGDGELDARAPEQEGPAEVRRFARTMNETAAKLGALVSSQHVFVADASHQLRTPITALRLRLENLERDVAPEGQMALSSAVAETERLTRLVSDLLALARPQTPAEPTVSLDLAALIRARVAAWSALADERGVSLSARHETMYARVGGARMEQVLDILLANALEASAPGAVVHIRAAARDAWVELHVIDEGPGLTAEQRTRAFDRFWRAGDGDGAGLGLAVARRLLAVDEGEIELVPAQTGGIDAFVRVRRGETPARRPGTPSSGPTRGESESGNVSRRRALHFRFGTLHRAAQRVRARS